MAKRTPVTTRSEQGWRPQPGFGPLLVVGDLICDRYVWGGVERVSPEAPVQVLHWESEADPAGGAANVAVNLASLGCAVRVAGIVGRDAAGRWLVRDLKRQGIDTGGIVVSHRRATTLKTRIMARGQQLLRVDREDPGPLERADERALAAAVRRGTRGARGIVCSDYDKGVLTDSVLARVLPDTTRAARQGPTVLVDPKGTDYARYRHAHILTPNETELVDATPGVRATGDDDGDMASRVRRLHVVTRCRAVLVTRGARGMDLFEFGRGDARRLHIDAAQTHEVYDVTGAGDTVTAVMALAAAQGVTLGDAARFANAAAAVVVRHVGTAVVEPDTLEQATRAGGAAAGSKVLTPAALRRYVGDARARGNRIVLTNGCFDLLHTGHIHLLQRARALGDTLVVAVNDDASVRRLKGAGRPLVADGERARLLAALSCVDAVTVFPEATPLNVIRAVRPDVLVKGSDYAIDEVVGRTEVEAGGGRVELVELLPGFSTTALAQALAAPARATP